MLYSTNQQEALELTVEESNPDAISFYYDYRPPSITISLRPCPWGFTLQHNPPYCDCDPQLVRYDISCNINKQTIQRKPPVWIGYYSAQLNNSHLAGAAKCTESDEEECRGVVVHHNCPYDHCKNMIMDISVNSTNEQCQFNRTGILCGACPHGLSTVLGSSMCLPCSNLYLLLLIPFALAGLLLVFFLTACNLTVSEGTINGLIFYANIVQFHDAIFFRKHIPVLTDVLKLFIAWINLDLGFETCFYNGMDAYGQTWLQFAFPIYIWMIAGLIITLSRRFTTVAKLMGKNAVQVLATLFLLSFAKLERTIFTALSRTTLLYPDGYEKVVWSPDGNVAYLHGMHILLFITALLIGMIALPLVLVLTFIPCLQKKSGTPLLFWVTRLKPLFDAYTGPYKNTFRFWTDYCC